MEYIYTPTVPLNGVQHNKETEIQQLPKVTAGSNQIKSDFFLVLKEFYDPGSWQEGIV